jgi:hypothetical protein
VGRRYTEICAWCLVPGAGCRVPGAWCGATMP